MRLMVIRQTEESLAVVTSVTVDWSVTAGVDWSVIVAVPSSVISIG